MHGSTRLLMVVSSTLFAIAGFGCSDHKAATDDNFAPAIASYLDSDPECVRLPRLGSIPGEMSAGRGGNSSDDYIRSSPPEASKPVTNEEFFARNKLEAALASKGFIEVKIAQREAEAYPGATRTEMRSFAEVSLTDKGKPWYREVSSPLGKQAAFCFAQKQLVKIDNFTEPADMMGQKVSRVTFTWQLGDIAEWARDETINAADGRVKAALEKVGKPQSGKAALILTNQGWVHEKLFGASARQH